MASLPPNSPLCRPMLKALMKGITEKQATEYFVLSKRSFKRITEGDSEILISIKYQLHTKKQQLHPDAIKLVKELSDMQVTFLYHTA